MDRVRTDVLSAWRVLRRRPRFAMVLVAVLGGSLGTSATVLTIADAYLWRPFPYPSADRLVTFPQSGPPAHARLPRDQSVLTLEAAEQFAMRM